MADNISSFAQCRDLFATDPTSFAYDVLRIEYLTCQQESLLRDLGEFVYCNMLQQSAEDYTAALMNPRLESSKQLQDKLARLTDELDGHVLTKEQRETFVRKNGFAISSGRDTGKSCVLSIIAWWFLCSFEQPQGYIMSPTGQQARAILMAEVSLWGNRKIEDYETGEKEYAFLLRDQFEVQAESIRFKSAPKERFIEVKRVDDKASREDQITSMSGFHSPQQMFFIDEAVKFQDHIIETLNATNSRPVNFSIMIFNPVRSASYAVQSVFGDRSEGWISRVWNCEESDKPGMKEHVKSLEDEYGGTDNDLYRVNVQGLPAVNSSDEMFPLLWMEEARTRSPLYPDSQFICIGHDVAGEGSDDATTFVRRGHDIIEIHVHQGKDDFYQVDFLYDLYRKYKPQEINIDVIGIGRAVYTMLRSKGCHAARAVNVAKKAKKHKEKFRRLRDQYYFNLRDEFKEGKISFSLKTGEKEYTRLKRELVATGFKVQEDLFSKVYSKDKIKEQLNGKSPDLADGLMLCFCGNDYDVTEAHGLSEYRTSKWEKRFREKEMSSSSSYSHFGADSWMLS